MVSFYTELLGLIVIDRGEFLGRQLTFLSRRAGEHHQLVLVTGRKVPEGDFQLLSQLSFRLDDDSLPSLRWFHRTALELGAGGMEGRNHGNSWSIYFTDPEGNRLELYTSTPWYVSQPWRVVLDLEDSDEVIREKTKALVEETGTWAPVEEWTAEVEAKLAAQAADAVDLSAGSSS